MSQPNPEAYTPLTPLSFHILLSLAAGEQHGYGLMKEVRERTAGQLDPATGTVYLALSRLEEDGLIGEVADPPVGPDERRRRYFFLTELGRRVATAEATRLAGLLGLAVERDLVGAATLGVVGLAPRRRKGGKDD